MEPSIFSTYLLLTAVALIVGAIATAIMDAKHLDHPHAAPQH